MMLAMNAAVDPRGILIRQHLAEAGERHGRSVMAVALDRVCISGENADAVVAVMEGEVDRMSAIYREAGCSRRQVKAFVQGFYLGAAAGSVEALHLLDVAHEGTS